MEEIMPDENLKEHNLNDHRYLLFFLIISILFRLIITVIASYSIDMGGYTAWSGYLADNGPADLYAGSGYHIVYAPFFLYFLWITGEIVKAFSLPYAIHTYLIKLWSVAFEFLGAALILKFSRKINKLRQGYIMAFFYLLNPGIYINSSVWGQFDSIPATMLLGVLYLFDLKKKNPAALLFLIAVLTKPQSGLLLPVVLYLYFKDFRFDFICLKKLMIGLLSGVFLYLAVVLPFYSPTTQFGRIPGFLDPFYWIFDLYFRSLNDYPYATANGFNLWILLGGQIQEDTLPFLGLSYSRWGYMLLAAGLAYAFLCLIKGKGTSYAVTYFSFLVLFSSFLFLTRMHERYLLTAIIFITLACVYDMRHFLTAVLLSICVFSNQLYLYIISFDKRYWLDRWDGFALFFSALTLATYIIALFRGYKAFINHTPAEGEIR
jgi:Gpi18-like mannosyltransferase